MITGLYLSYLVNSIHFCKSWENFLTTHITKLCILSEPSVQHQKPKKK